MDVHKYIVQSVIVLTLTDAGHTKARRASSRNHMKGPRKRTDEDDQRFAESFEKLLRKVKEL